MFPFIVQYIVHHLVQYHSHCLYRIVKSFFIFFITVSVASNISGVVANNLSGMMFHQEVTNETDKVAAGDPKDVI